MEKNRKETCVNPLKRNGLQKLIRFYRLLIIDNRLQYVVSKQVSSPAFLCSLRTHVGLDHQMSNIKTKASSDLACFQ